MALDKSKFPNAIEVLQKIARTRISRSRAAQLRKLAEEHGLFDSDEVEDPGDLARMLEPLLEALRLGGVRSAAAGRQRYRTPEVLTPEEAKREEVLSWLIGLRAADLPQVRDFRRRFVGPTLFDEARAVAFLRSDVYRMLTATQMVLEGMPTFGLVGQEFPPPPAPHAPSGAHYSQELAGGGWVTIKRYAVRCEWALVGGDRSSRDVVFEVPSSGRGDEVEPSLRWRVGKGEASGETPLVAGSVLDELGRLAEDLSERTFWPRDLAIWFVLTGEVPASESIQLSRLPSPSEPALQLMLTLRARAWVSYDSVAKAYRDLQRWAVGRERRAIPIPKLERFRFVHERMLVTPMESWPSIADAWAAHAKSSGGEERREWAWLLDDYLGTLETLLHPDLAMGQKEDDMPFAAAVSQRYRAEESARFRDREIEKLARSVEKSANTEAASDI